MKVECDGAASRGVELNDIQGPLRIYATLLISEVNGSF